MIHDIIEGLYNTWSYPLNATCSPCHACETCGKPLITFLLSFLLRKHQKLSKLSPSPPSSLAFTRKKILSFLHKVSIYIFFFILVILTLLPLKNQKLEKKNEVIEAKGKPSSSLYCYESQFPPQSILQQTFPKVQNVPLQKCCGRKCRSFNRLLIAKSTEFQKCRMFFAEYFIIESFRSQNIDLSTNYLQQNLRNFKSVECIFTEYFIVENFKSQNVDLFADYLQQNLLNFRMFIGRIFRSRIPTMQSVHRHNISQQNPRNAECSFAKYLVGENFRSQSANISADYSLQNILQQNFLLNSNRSFRRISYHKIQYRILELSKCNHKSNVIIFYNKSDHCPIKNSCQQQQCEHV